MNLNSKFALGSVPVARTFGHAGTQMTEKSITKISFSADFLICIMGLFVFLIQIIII